MRLSREERREKFAEDVRGRQLPAGRARQNQPQRSDRIRRYLARQNRGGALRKVASRFEAENRSPALNPKRATNLNYRKSRSASAKHKMEFGIHTFVWTEGREQAELEAAMESAKAAGFSLLEFPGLDPKSIDIQRLARRAGELDLKVAASAGLRPDLDLTSSDPECVRRGEAFLNEAVSVARDLGSPQLSGPIFSAHQKFPTLPTPEGWRSSTEVLGRVADKAKGASVALCLELFNRYETNLINTVKQGIAYIRDTGSDNIFLHIDTFHMNIEEADQAQAIRRAGDYIGYFHVGENHRGFLGSGHDRLRADL